MRILLVGAGGVGNAIAKLAAERSFFETMVVADYDRTRPLVDGRVKPEGIDLNWSNLGHH